MKKWKELLPVSQENAVPLLSADFGQDTHEALVFDKDFLPSPIQYPSDFLPEYKQNMKQNEEFIEKLMTKCGQCSIYCGYCCVCFCCKCHCCFYELPTSMAGIVERFGQFNRLLKPGLNIINPCTEKVTEIDMKIKIIKVGHSGIITKDNVKLTVNSSISYRIVNPIVSYYILGEEVQHALIELTNASFRTIMGLHVLEEILRKRFSLISEVKAEIAKNISKGVLVQNVFIEDILIPPDIERGLNSVARQKRISQGSIIETKGDVQAAKLMKESAQLLDTKAAMQVRYLQMIERLGENEITLVMEIGIDKKGFKL